MYQNFYVFQKAPYQPIHRDLNEDIRQIPWKKYQQELISQFVLRRVR